MNDTKITNIFPYGFGIAGSLYETPMMHITEMLLGALLGAVVGYFVKKGFDCLFKFIETKNSNNAKN